MAVAYGTIGRPGLLSQQYAPPLLPKPGKDNVRLQKLLKRTAKKKASAQASQSTAPFRSSLSPVNEASPDLERSDHFTPPRTPETSPSLFGVPQAPRFTVRPLYQHVPSPYPQRAAFGRAAKMSPPTVALPTYSYSQHAATILSHSLTAHHSDEPTLMEHVSQPVVAKKSQLYSIVPDVILSTPGPSSHIPSEGQAVIRPLTVLTTIVKSRSPRPTFKATEPSKSPKPMFEVPQIRMYTASTSYYETTRTPPVYDSAGLTAIGSTVSQSKTSTETKQKVIEVSEVRGGKTPTAQPPSLERDAQRHTILKSKMGSSPLLDVDPFKMHTTESKIATPGLKTNGSTLIPIFQDESPAPEMQRATPTIDAKRATPTSDVKRASPISDAKRATPTSEVKRATPTSDVKRTTPTIDVKRATPTSDVKRATPTFDVQNPSFDDERVKTPTYEFQASRYLAGRPRTPACHVTRPTTPIFEVSRPNPLLFAVSPITVESERPKTHETLSKVSSSPTILSGKSTDLHMRLANGDISSVVVKPAVKIIQQNITESTTSHDLTKGRIPTPADGIQKSETPASGPLTPEVTIFQRPKTPTYEASRLMTISHGYKRPKTPTHSISAPNVSGTAVQKLTTPLSQKPKSAYRGLTPAEYAAYGGIKTYSPAFGISSSEMATKDEVKEIPGQSSQESKVKETVTDEVPKTEESPKDLNVLDLMHQKLSAMPSTPVIVVSQASDFCDTTLPEVTETVSVGSVAKQEVAVIQTVETHPTPANTISETQREEILVQQTKTNTAATKPEERNQDPLKAVKRLLGKNKDIAVKEEVKPATKANIYAEQEQVTQMPPAKIKPEGQKPSLKALDLKVTTPESDREDKQKEKTPEKASEEKKEAENLPPSEQPLKVMQKLKGAKSKGSGWSRLKKHMVVEQEEPKFPEKDSQKEVTEQDQDQAKIVKDTHETEPRLQDETQTKEMATQMWDAVLFQMFSSKENIMHQIELNQSEGDKKEEESNELKEIPSFAYRLPVLLFSPKFDAKKLREAASRPVTKISTVFEMGLIGRKGKDEEPKDFNRTARGFTAP
ncbi:mucin-5B [Oryzias melastigma]|uniref:Mucin-5B-like n=1 Tax=Oryzias melastigma TaxID=30732 RepID=A0A3B3DW92_ORYME|nr:mucin-5B [Oryzias melastigma]